MKNYSKNKVVAICSAFALLAVASTMVYTSGTLHGNVDDSFDPSGYDDSFDYDSYDICDPASSAFDNDACNGCPDVCNDACPAHDSVACACQNDPTSPECTGVHPSPSGPCEEDPMGQACACINAPNSQACTGVTPSPCEEDPMGQACACVNAPNSQACTGSNSDSPSNSDNDDGYSDYDYDDYASPDSDYGYSDYEYDYPDYDDYDYLDDYEGYDDYDDGYSDYDSSSSADYIDSGPFIDEFSDSSEDQLADTYVAPAAEEVPVSAPMMITETIIDAILEFMRQIYGASSSPEAALPIA